MFERFTQEARNVLTRAQREARELQHNFIGTEHLLLGMDGSTAGALLGELGAPMAVLREAVIDIVGRSGAPPTSSPPFTPRAKKALELSLREALSRDDKTIRPEHLLLGVARERDGVGCQVLASAGISYEAIAGMVGPPREPARRFWRRGPGLQPVVRGDVTPGAESALLAARRMAGGEAISTYHLLRALFGDGAAGRILDTLGVTPDQVGTAFAELGTAGTSDEVPLSIELQGENFSITPEQADQIRRYLAGGPPPLPPEA